MRLSKFLKGSEAGQSMVIIVFGFFAIIAFVGFALDTSILFLNRMWLGQAVDASTLAAGYELPNIRGACARAVEYLQMNDYVVNPDFRFEIVFPAVPDAPNGDPGVLILESDVHGIQNPEDCATVNVPMAHENVHYEVQVIGEQQVPVSFMSILGFGKIRVGIEGLAERTHNFDIALVLDNSGSMDYDTCGYHRDVVGDPEGYTSYAANNLYPLCTSIVGDDFESYAGNDQFIIEWYKTGPSELRTSGGVDNSNYVWVSGGEIANTYSVQDSTDVAVFFHMKSFSLYSGDYVDIQWRIWDGISSPAPAWVPLSTFEGDNISTEWQEYGIILPAAVSETEFLSLRFMTRDLEPGEGVGIDNFMLKSCPAVREELLPVQDYVSGGDGCTISGQASPMNAHIYVPENLIPMVPKDVNQEPVSILLQQPLYHVLRSTETFIDLIDSRRFDFSPPLPREDQFSLTSFSTTANLLYDLTLDYEAIQETLFKGIRSDSWTNIGDGMRVGLDTLSGGRSDTIHFMILLTDGWPNRYGSAGYSCGSSMPCPETFTWIDEQIEYANNQNVTIFTIGLGNALTDVTFSAYGDPNYNGQKLLERIAQRTGGESYHAPTTDELEAIFEWIAEAIFVRLKE
jgi:hypothetical protein